MVKGKKKRKKLEQFKIQINGELFFNLIAFQYNKNKNKKNTLSWEYVKTKSQNFQHLIVQVQLN